MERMLQSYTSGEITLLSWNKQSCSKPNNPFRVGPSFSLPGISSRVIDNNPFRISGSGHLVVSIFCCCLMMTWNAITLKGLLTQHRMKCGAELIYNPTLKGLLNFKIRSSEISYPLSFNSSLNCKIQRKKIK